MQAEPSAIAEPEQPEQPVPEQPVAEEDAPKMEAAAAKPEEAGPAPPAEDETAKQIRVDGLHQFTTIKQVKELLEKDLKLAGVRKVKKMKDTHAFIYFHTVEQREVAEAALEGHWFKKRQLWVRQVQALDPDRFLKRQHEAGPSAAGDGNEPDSKRPRQEEPEAPLRTAADLVAPLHAMPYEEQLKKKRENLLGVLRKLPKAFTDASQAMQRHEREPWLAKMPWLKPQRVEGRDDGLVCDLAQVVPSPVTHGYRNKCEFSIGRDADGAPCVGFVLGRVRQVGFAAIGAPTDCPNVSDEMKLLAEAMQARVRAPAQPPFDKGSNVGFWRQLNVRQTFNGGSPPQMLAVVCVQTLGVSADDVEAEIAALEQHMRGAAALAAATRLSFAVQVSNGPGEASASDDAGLRVLFGQGHVEETLMGIRYEVSPSAFFQVNTAAAERLITLLRTQCGLGPKTTLLDVCCGTGAIGLSMAAAVRKVYGIEMCVAAVEDAKRNAQRNGITNACFVAGRAEDKITSVLRGLTREEKEHVVAIVDPPRAGLHDSVLKALRACQPLKRILYVSCHSASFIKNAVALCRPPSNNFKESPFRLRHAFPVDLFPHTDHCELVVLLERDDAPAITTAPAAAAPEAAAAPAPAPESSS